MPQRITTRSPLEAGGEKAASESANEKNPTQADQSSLRWLPSIKTRRFSQAVDQSLGKFDP